MLESYIFVHKDYIDKIDGCGMKLSLWHDRHVILNGEECSYISSLLNPRDDMNKYRSSDYKVVKLKIDIKYCYIAEGFLYENNPEFKKEASLYSKTIIPAKDYVFGMYRRPECLISKTIMPEEMSIAGNSLGFPLFYDSSENLYLNKIIQDIREANSNFDDFVLYYYFDSLARDGKIKKVLNEKAGVVAFTFDDGRKPIVLNTLPQEALVEG